MSTPPVALTTDAERDFQANASTSVAQSSQAQPARPGSSNPKSIKADSLPAAPTASDRQKASVAPPTRRDVPSAKPSPDGAEKPTTTNPKSPKPPESTAKPSTPETVAPAVTKPHAPPAIPKEPTWIGKDGFPYRVAMAQAAVYQQRDSKDPNQLRGKLELQNRQARLRAVIEEARRAVKRERTKLFVIDANERAVTVLADASWGWPTGDLFVQSTGLEERAPKAGLIWLAPEKQGCRDCISLPVGAVIPPAVASTLRWGDRILVEFDIRDIAWRSARQLRSDRPSPITQLEEIVVVSVANLRCIDRDPRPVASSVWPAPGTFAEVISQRPDDYRFMFPFIRLTIKEATAQFKVKGVTEKQIEFDNFIAPNTAGVPVFAVLESLTEGINLPVSAVGAARAARLEPDQPVALSFKVKDIVPDHVLDPASYRTGFGYTSRKLAYAVIVTDLRWAEP